MELKKSHGKSQISNLVYGGGSDCKVSPSGRGELSNDLVSHISFKLEQKKKKTTNFFFFFLSFLLLELLTEKIPRLIDTHLFLFFLSKITFLIEFFLRLLSGMWPTIISRCRKKRKKNPTRVVVVVVGANGSHAPGSTAGVFAY